MLNRLIKNNSSYIENIYVFLLMIFSYFSFIEYHYSRKLILPILIIGLFILIKNHNLHKIYKNKFAISIIIFLSYLGISLLWSSDTHYGLGIFKKVSAIIIVPIAILILDDKSKIKLFVSFYLGLLTNIIIIWIIRLKIIHVNFDFIHSPIPRVNYIYVSFAVGLLSIITIYLLFESIRLKKYKISFFYFIITLISISTHISLKGRGGLLAFLVSLFILVVIYYRKKFKTLIILFLIIIISSISAYNLSNTLKARVHKTIINLNKVIEQNNFHSSLGYRLALWKIAIPIAKKNLLFGTGTGGQLNAMKQYIKKNPEYNYLNSFTNAHFHSEIFENMVQLGIIGFLIYLNMFWQFIKVTNFDIKSIIFTIYFFTAGATHIQFQRNTILYVTITMLIIIYIYSKKEHDENS